MAIEQSIPERSPPTRRFAGSPGRPKASDRTPGARAGSAPGRPVEIEDWTNLRIVHPLSRRLVDALIPTGVTPNAVSALGVVMAAAAAASYTLLPWPACAFAGFAFHVGWHVFDGADGDLARRTGRSSTIGELVDGVCDYLSHAVLYLALALFLARQIGPWAWPVTALAAVSNAWQANSYESGRRNYWRWMYGASWIKQALASAASGPAGPGRRVLIALGKAYLAASARVTADDGAVDALMGRLLARGPAAAEAARAVYRACKAPGVKRASWLGENHKTMALFASMLLLRTPLWHLLYVGVVLNLVLVWTVRAQAADNAALARELEALERGAAE